MIGRTEEEYGRHRGLPDDLVERRQALYARVRATGKPVTFEEARPRADGQGVRWTLKRLFPLPGADGQLLLGCALDVSDRVQAETLLRGREARYRTLLDSLLDLLMIVGDDGVVSYAAPSARRLLGTSPSDLRDRTLAELVHPDDHAALDDLLTTDRDDMVELRLQRQDDRPARLGCQPSPPTWRHFEAQAADLRSHPQVAGFVVVARDITQRLEAEQAVRASEEALRQSQKMEALGRLAGGLAHDFNNLLTAIRGYCGLLQESVDGPQAGYVHEIAAASDRAAELTSKLLTLSRRQLVSRRVVAVNDQVADLESLLRRLIGEDVELVTDLSTDVGQVRADPHQLDQALLNLVVNARDAMPQGGRIVVRTERVELSLDDIERRPDLGPGAYVLLTVSDTGVGMDHETLEHVFEPFFTTKESGKGTGLGLATVYASIHQEGGHIEVQSAPGRGAVFQIFLPEVEADPDVAPAPEKAHQGRLRGTETILLVEDEDIVRRLVRRQLEGLGYSILDAVNGEAALEVAQRNDVDLLVSDVVMPGMSGPELARRLVDQQPGLPVLFMSGYTDAFVGRHGFSEGEHEVLQKPFDQTELARRIRELLDRP